MFEIIEYIKTINSISSITYNKNNTYKETIKRIDYAFTNLFYCINLLIKQFETYKKIIGILGFNKDHLEITQQNNMKINLMKKILTLMTKNYEVFENYKCREKKGSTILNVKRFSLITYNENENLKINKLVIEYFKEYGPCLFILREEKKDDNSFIY